MFAFTSSVYFQWSKLPSHWKFIARKRIRSKICTTIYLWHRKWNNKQN